MNTNLPTEPRPVSAHVVLPADQVEAKLVNDQVNITVSGEHYPFLSIYLDPEVAAQLAEQITDAVRTAEYSAERGVRDAGSGAAAGEYPHHLLDGDTDAGTP